MKDDNSAVHIFQCSSSIPTSNEDDKHYQLIETNYRSQTPNLNAYFNEKPKDLIINNCFTIQIINNKTPKVITQNKSINKNQGIIDEINELKQRHTELINVNTKLKSTIEEMNKINEQNITIIINQEEEIKQLNAQLLKYYSKLEK